MSNIDTANIYAFGPGAGRLRLGAPQAPLVIQLAPGVRPEDVLIESFPVSVVKDSYGVPVGSWSWGVRIKGYSDILTINGASFGADPLPVDGLGDVVAIRFDDGTVWSSDQVLAFLHDPAHSSAQALGSSQADLMVGDGRAHTVYGFAGDDTLVSGAGDETLIGGAGLNQYRFAAGFGHDVVVSDWQADEIVLGDGLLSATAKIERRGMNLRITWPDNTDVLTLSNLGSAGATIEDSASVLRFADGVSMSVVDLFARYFQQGSDGSDDLMGSMGAQVLAGGVGDDAITGQFGGDSLDGGAGDDIFYVRGGTAYVDGGAGNDVVWMRPDAASTQTTTIRFGRGGGHDDILDIRPFEQYPATPINIVFDADVKSTDVSFYGGDGGNGGLLVRINDTGDTLSLAGNVPTTWSAFAWMGSFAPFTFTFADGVTINNADIMNGKGGLRTAPTGGTVVGTSGADTLTSNDGFDTLAGGGGSDTYVIHSPIGAHVVDLTGAAPDSTQTIAIQGNLNPDDIRVSTSRSTGDQVLLSYGSGAVAISHWDGLPNHAGLNIQFDNGTVWSESDLRSRISIDTGSTSGPDTYYLSPGQGNHAISHFRNGAGSGGEDVIVLSTHDVSFQMRHQDFSSSARGYHPIYDIADWLEITFNQTGETVNVCDRESLLYDWYLAYPNDFLKTDNVVIRFSDGDSLTGKQLAQRIAEQQPVQLTGSVFEDTLQGSVGDDVLAAGGGDDTIILNRAFIPGGHDVVLFNVGDGRDTVVCESGDGYTLRFGAGISPDSIYLSAGSALAVSGGYDRVEGARPARVEFADGTVWDAAMLNDIINKDLGTQHVFHGTVTDDYMIGRGGADQLLGGTGNDTLDGGGGANLLQGGEGNDRLYGHDGADTLQGGAGNDDINSGGASNVVAFDRGDGADTVSGGGYTLQLGPGITLKDVQVDVYVQPDSQVQPVALQFGQGDSINISWGMPAQIVFADGSRTTVQDILNARFKGTSGNDTIIGSDAADKIVGLDGADYLQGMGGDDTIDGGAGNDLIDPGAGVDYIRFGHGDGQDTLMVGDTDILFFKDDVKAADVVYRKAANGTVYAGFWDSLDEVKLVSSNNLAGLTVWLANGVSTTGATVLSQVGINRHVVGTEVTGSTFNSFTGDDWYDFRGVTDRPGVTIYGAGGRDVLLGTVAGDSLDGGVGDDTIMGNGGRDTLTGGAGSDQFVVQQSNSGALIKADGTDVVVLGDGLSADQVKVVRQGAAADDRAVVFFGAGAVATTDIVLNQFSQLGGLTLKFNDGRTLSGAQLLGQEIGALQINVAADPSAATGSNANDAILGSNGDDTLRGGLGDDTLTGGAGHDVYRIDRGEGHDVIHADDLDTLMLSSSLSLSDVIVGPWSAAQPDQVVLSFANSTDTITIDNIGDALNMQVGIGASTLRGSDLVAMSGKPLDVNLTGTAGADVLAGKVGNDTLYGLAGNDTLTGGDGADILIGGAGDDVMSGDAGADIYRYDDANLGFDVIHADSADTIVFSSSALQLSDLQVQALDAAHPDQVSLRVKGYTGGITIDNLRDAQGLTVQIGGGSVTGAELLSKATSLMPQTLTGTSGKDVLSGKDGNDTLSGLAGNDTLAGGKGDDLLNGGKGNDTYLFAAGDGHDTIVDNDSTWFNSDLLKISGAKSNQLWLSRSGNNLEVSVIGTKDHVTVQDWYLGSSHYVEKITAGDGKSLSYTKVQSLVNAMASFAAPAEGQTSLPSNTPASITKLIASSWA